MQTVTCAYKNKNQRREGNQMMKYCIGIDMGGTTVKLGLFSREGQLLERDEIATRWQLGRQTVLKDIAASARTLTGRRKIPLHDCTAGFGVAGPIDSQGYADAVVNLNMYDFYPGRELSEKLDNIPVTAANDANVAALGEMWQGGGKGYQNLLFITLGTGVGSGIVLNEKIIHGAHGLAGEIGHIWVNPHEPETCSCGGKGCLDQMASATGIVRNARRFLAKTEAESSLRQINDLTAKDVFDAAKAGDAVARETVDYCMGFLGKSIADVSYVIDPEIVVIGGGMSKAGQYLLDVVFDHYRRYPKLKKTLCRFALADLGGDAGIYGAARLALDL